MRNMATAAAAWPTKRRRLLNTIWQNYPS
jgi:hypothetical protein